MRILLVDDSKTILHAVSKMLTELGYTDIHTSENPQDAEERIKIIPPDLIISDWNMPKGSGLDLLKFVRTNNETSKIPFILLTSDHDKSKIIQAKAYSPQAYILKPMTKKQIADRLAIISRTHGIQAPSGMPDINIEEALTIDEMLPLDVKSEDITNILKKLILVHSNKMDRIIFATWLGEHIFKKNREDVSRHDMLRLEKTLSDVIGITLKSLF